MTRYCTICLLLLLLGCGGRPVAFDGVQVTAIERGTNVLFRTTVEDRKTIEALLECFPGWNSPPKEGKPSELPDPYTYVLVFSAKDRNVEIKVHGPLPGAYPGLWRHPSGVHFYLEGNKPYEFHNIMLRLKKSSQQDGAVPGSQPIRSGTNQTSSSAGSLR